MAFATFFFLTWIAFAILFLMKNKLSFLEYTFIYLVVLIVNINFSWIIGEEFKWIKSTKEPIVFVALLFHRILLLPLIILISINLMKGFNRTLLKFIVAGGFIFFLVVTSGLVVHMHLVTYENWTYLYDCLYFVSLLFIANGSYRLIHPARQGEVKSV
ncbi:hypothetical protein [Bacillus sp. 2205SS5-2]|uniref:hypothetical protein n=1 Tax=Bacillus sp. 2205SS5-2 TaxID=3109031 RepID=UPI003004527F